MPISYTQSSSSEASFDSGCLRADGDYGVPRHCFCGKVLKLEVSTTVEDRGRKFYKCPMSEDGGDHIGKWWDNAVDEELTKINIRLEEHKDQIANAFRYGGGANPSLESIHESMRRMRVEIDDLKDHLAQKEGEIGRLKELLGKW